ncbi:MAG: hypothetical protein PUF91_01920 [Lactobacillus delbrueckii]|uniref:hypothetical protein n=1 Tax=Lactobacillus equicursoris TaxID=420645 RepID=UPI00242F1A6B|nr:hypothetical protein [Lactobacillus equicursoris]MDD6385961.1 hypothetical protein [Lactobacillus equicursoris]MDD6420157.1 hypothetical protein [Lactobacillus delbrueckii]
MEKFNQAEFNKVINSTVSGLQMFVRDVNLPKEIAGKYKTGMLIHELGYTDASHRVGGMITSHRFTILSNHMADLASFEQGTNWGLCVAQRGAHFLVLDVYEAEGHTQISLLHLPDDQWQIFEQVNFQMDSLVSNVREIFEKNLSSAPIPELTTADWLRRCAAPLGIADNGAPFPL